MFSYTATRSNAWPQLHPCSSYLSSIRGLAALASRFVFQELRGYKIENIPNLRWRLRRRSHHQHLTHTVLIRALSRILLLIDCRKQIHIFILMLYRLVEPISVMRTAHTHTHRTPYRSLCINHFQHFPNSSQFRQLSIHPFDAVPQLRKKFWL